jgi:DnaJ-class molecular chaperone
MPVYLKKGEYGDLFVKIIAEVPQNLSEEERSLFRKLEAMHKV